MFERKVKIESLAGRVSDGQVYIQEWSKSERIAKSLKVLGLFWFCGVAFVFIPFLHFFLVPSCLVLGPVMAIQAYRKIVVVTGGSGSCPECRAEFKIEKGSAAKWPISDLCNSCHCGVTIQLVPVAN